MSSFLQKKKKSSQFTRLHIPPIALGSMWSWEGKKKKNKIGHSILLVKENTNTEMTYYLKKKYLSGIWDSPNDFLYQCRPRPLFGKRTRWKTALAARNKTFAFCTCQQHHRVAILWLQKHGHVLIVFSVSLCSFSWLHSSTSQQRSQRSEGMGTPSCSSLSKRIPSNCHQLTLKNALQPTPGVRALQQVFVPDGGLGRAVWGMEAIQAEQGLFSPGEGLKGKFQAEATVLRSLKSWWSAHLLSRPGLGWASDARMD